MKRILYSFIFVSFLFNNCFASTYSNDPKFFVKELVEDAIKTLGDKTIPRADKNKKIEEIALNNVDIEALGMYTLGEIRKSLDSDTIKKYQELFEKYFLKSLTSRLTDYSNQKFEVLSSDQKSDNYNIVSSRLVESASQPEIKIDWRIYTKDPSKPLIRDLIVEGLSLARTQKEEFASILNSNNNDINILFSKLEDFIKN